MTVSLWECLIDFKQKGTVCANLSQALCCHLQQYSRIITVTFSKQYLLLTNIYVVVKFLF